MNTSKLKSGTVTVIKTIVAPVHVTLQASADLLALGEAKLINSIDGTPIYESVMNRTAYTQNKIESVVAKAMEIKERRDAKKEQARLSHINSLKSKLDQAEGIEHSESSIQESLNKDKDWYNNLHSEESSVPPAPPIDESTTFKTPLQAFGNELIPTT